MSRNLYKKIGQRIKKARERAGMSQEELAARMEYKSAATISHFEKGLRKISIADLQTLSGILGVTLEGLIEGDGQGIAVGMQQFMLRANIVKPTARKAVADFLTFIQTRSEIPKELPLDISDLQPGYAANKILSLAECGTPPVSPRSIAQQLNIPVFDWDFPNDISGLFATNDSKVCIGVNRNHPNVRQRFTIAHELGHFIFHRDIALLIDFYHADIVASGDDETGKRETKANQFAADLLMPKNWIERNYRGPDELPLLATEYNVSEQALWYRLVTLKLV